MTDHPQLGLSLPSAVTYAPEDFVVSPSNQDAYEALVQQEWQVQVFILYGPEASGKTHLAQIWAQQANAIFIPPHSITKQAVAEWMAAHKLASAILVDGVEAVEDETALFHLLNGVREQNGRLLLTSNVAPSHLPVELADARSRLNAAPAAALHAPDEDTLRAVLIKQFSDRQLRVGDDVLHYLLLRMDRSFASARGWVERIDKEALAAQRRVTVAWLRELMDKTNG